jgi:signal transduction histidine kinase
MTTLRDFIGEHRDEILARAQLHASSRSLPTATEAELSSGLPLFVEQLSEALLRASTLQLADHKEIKGSAASHGQLLFERGLTIEQVVHDYGHVCQAITGLAVERKAAIASEDFQTLNLCLDDAIAGAAAAYGNQRERAIADEGTERLGVLAHEMRNLLNTALMSFESIKAGVVAPGGSTSAMLERSLMGLLTLIDRSMAEVRLDAGMQNLERVPVWEVLTEVQIGASMVARKRGLQFVVTSVDHAVIVEADRQTLCAAVANLVQNALKFTRRGTTVTLRANATASRVLIDVEDECGGLPPGEAEDLLQPFSQQGRDRTGLGLGLSICVKAVKAIGGELHIKNLAGKGCIFTIDLPKQPPPPTSIHARDRTRDDGDSGSGGQAARAVARTRAANARSVA